MLNKPIIKTPFFRISSIGINNVLIVEALLSLRFLLLAVKCYYLMEEEIKAQIINQDDTPS